MIPSWWSVAECAVMAPVSDEGLGSRIFLADTMFRCLLNILRGGRSFSPGSSFFKKYNFGHDKISSARLNNYVSGRKPINRSDIFRLRSSRPAGLNVHHTYNPHHTNL